MNNMCIHYLSIVDINECASSPCVHGSCNNLQNHWSCNCDPGYEEYNCGYGKPLGS